MNESKPPPRRQCAKCPWKVGVNPYDIPAGYDVKKHKALKVTIAEPGSFRGTDRAFACHETPSGAEKPCVGWLAHQLGPGNNLALRLNVMTGSLDANIETVGEQHERFEDTLPKTKRARRKERA